MRIGLNVQVSALLPGDLAAIAACCSAVLWIYQRSEEPAVRAAMAQLPALVHYARPYPEPWPSISLAGFAGCVIGNESNLPPSQEPDSWGGDPRSYVARKVAVARAIKAASPACRVISPALSPGVPGWQGQLPLLTALVAACDLVGVHRYAGVDAVAAYRAAFPGRPLAITEQGDPRGDPLWVTDGGDPVLLFAARWQGHAGEGWDVLARPDVVARLAALKEQPKKGHPMPAPLFQFMQDAGSSDCWCDCIRSFFLRYGYPLDLDLVFQAGKGYARPAGGEPATFSTVKHAITVLAQQLGVKVQMADFDAPNVVAAALHDPDTANPWTVIAGVREADLQPGQNYGHFILLDHQDANGMVKVVDSYTNVDGDLAEYYPFSQVAQAMIDNWEPQIDAIGVKIVS